MHLTEINASFEQADTFSQHLIKEWIQNQANCLKNEISYRHVLYLKAAPNQNKVIIILKVSLLSRFAHN